MNVQNMAPNAKRSLLLTFVFAALAVCIYLFAVEPAITERDNTAKRLEELQSQDGLMARNLAGSSKVRLQLKELEGNLAAQQENLLVPLLESLAMRAKSILDPIALESNLEEVNYTELEPIALPVPKKLPVQLYARQPIKVTASGTYQSAISFLMRVEKRLPHVALESITINVLEGPDTQKVEMIFEWPVKGKSTKIEPPKKG